MPSPPKFCDFVRETEILVKRVFGCWLQTGFWDLEGHQEMRAAASGPIRPPDRWGSRGTGPPRARPGLPGSAEAAAEAFRSL